MVHDIVAVCKQVSRADNTMSLAYLLESGFIQFPQPAQGLAEDFKEPFEYELEPRSLTTSS